MALRFDYIELLFLLAISWSRKTTGAHCTWTSQGSEYTGTFSRTASGRTCLRWDSVSPHENEYTDTSLYPEDSLTEAANYCRNPSRADSGNWCYITDPNTVNETCNIPSCENLALHRLVRVNGVPEYAVGPIEGVTDGNIDLDFYHGGCNQISSTTGPWWQVELEQEAWITHLEIFNRDDNSAGVPSDFILRGSLTADVPAYTSTEGLCFHNTDVVALGSRKTYTCSVPLQARYITMAVLVPVQKVIICELRVYAAGIRPSSSSCSDMKGVINSVWWSADVSVLNDAALNSCIARCHADYNCLGLTFSEHHQTCALLHGSPYQNASLDGVLWRSYFYEGININ